ncbi:MAG: 50S ribosomal protein L9 [Anaerolineae bacterium]
MKVLLLEDVDNLGLAGDVKVVANGFARNYLIPQKMAVLATRGALKQADTVRKAGEQRRAADKADAEAIASLIDGLTFTFERRAGETGKLYGSVTANDIAEALSEAANTPIDKRKVAIGEPIRLLGEHDVSVKLMVEVTAQVKVVVVQQGALGAQAETQPTALPEAADTLPPAEAFEAEPVLEIAPEDSAEEEG